MGKKRGEEKVKRESIIKGGEVISCMCGAPLIQTTPIAAYYSGARVNCDICGVYCANSGAIYHCPAEKTTDHPEGYDLCVNCVKFQMRSFRDQSQPQATSQRRKSKQCNTTTTKEGEQKSTETPQGETVKKAPTVSESHTSNSNDPFEGFEYAKEARSIAYMGFTNVEKIKYLLVNKKGDTSQVINELLTDI